MIVKFRKYGITRKELQVETPIIRILRKGDEVEIEFNGKPSLTELREIARRLGLPHFEIEPKESRLRMRNKLKALMKHTKEVICYGLHDRTD